ncbi:MAG: hypothetical protein PHC85_00290 [Candidatus Pacebacteria bacterium]|nr:hypothetical protein [Candidatus Paceibacterota bacterium]
MEFIAFLFSPYPVAGLLALAAVFLIYHFLRSSREKEFFRSLDFTLFEIILPRPEKEEGKTFKDAIAVMEQFYSGMSGLKSHFALELVSPATENETNFYVSMPKSHASFFEKQLHAVFPSAEIREEKTDYNIFKYKYPTAAAEVVFTQPSVLPLRTYDELVNDPLSVIANVFSDIKREKEGAAFQIVINPFAKGLKSDVEKSLKLLQAGEPIKKALEGGRGFFEGFLDIIFHNDSKKGNSDPASMARGALSAAQEARSEVIKILTKKISKPIMSANIRLVASGQTEDRAQKILEEMKSAFSQFNDPRANSFACKDVSGWGLRKFFYNFSFRLFDKKRALVLNIAELTGIFHFPTTLALAPRMKFLKAKKAEPPINLSANGIIIGKNIFRDEEKEIKIAPDDRRRHFYSVGQTGTGKSVLMKNMVVQDIEEGRGVCFIDPHGDAVEEIMGLIPFERWNDIVYFNPGDATRPFGMNMLEFDSKYPEQKTFIINELLEIFNKLYDMKAAGGPMFEQYFRNATLLAMEDKDGTLLEISRVLSDSEFRAKMLSRTQNPLLKNFWTETAEKAGGDATLQNMVPYITSKFDTFLSNEIIRPVLCQSRSSFNFREAMDSGKIVLINLSKGRIGETNAYLLGMVFVGKLFMAAMSRADLPEEKRRDFFLYIDEFQNVTTNSISMILSEARKYRLCLNITHQFIGQLTEDIKKAVFGNVGSFAVFRIGKDDAEYLAKHFEPVFNAEDLMNIGNYNAYVKLLINGETSRPFNIETYAPAKSEEAVREKTKEVSAIKYGRPLREVESEINKRYLRLSGSGEAEGEME